MQSQPSTSVGVPMASCTLAKASRRFSTMSTPLAMVSTMPSSMAQKNVRLSSSLALAMERTKYCPPTRTTTGCVAKISGVSWSIFMPTRRANSGPAGRPLISYTMRCAGSARVTTMRRSDFTKCWVRKAMKGRSVRTRASKATLRWKAPW